MPQRRSGPLFHGQCTAEYTYIETCLLPAYATYTNTSRCRVTIVALCVKIPSSLYETFSHRNTFKIVHRLIDEQCTVLDSKYCSPTTQVG